MAFEGEIKKWKNGRCNFFWRRGYPQKNLFEEHYVTKTSKLGGGGRFI